jgi:hypothetical protein
VDGEAPAELVALGAQGGAVIGHQSLIVAAPGLGAAGGDAAKPFRFNELDPAGIGKSLFRRIDDLDNMATGAIGGQLADGAAEFGDRRPQIGQKQHFGERRRREIRRQARMLGGVVNDRLRHFLDDVAV